LAVLRFQSLELRNPLDEFRAAVAMAAKSRADALFVLTTTVFFRERSQIAQLAVSNRLPAVFALREFADAGGLMSYGTNLPEMSCRAAIYVHRILTGAKPADLPIEQATKFEFVIQGCGNCVTVPGPPRPGEGRARSCAPELTSPG